MNPAKSYTIDEAKQALEHYCSYQERTHRDVLEKLQKIGMQEEAQQVIILHLLQHNFLNEERFAKAFVGGKFRIKKWGKQKITQALQQKGVSNANITIGLMEIDEDNYQNTLIILAKKWMGFDKLNTADDQWSLAVKNLPYTKKQKLIRHLLQKGFELDLIYRLILNQ